MSLAGHWSRSISFLYRLETRRKSEKRDSDLFNIPIPMLLILNSLPFCLGSSSLDYLSDYRGRRFEAM